MDEATDPRWSWVGRSMAAGAAYDALFGLGVLFLLDFSAELLRLPVPEDPTYLRLNGIFLLLLAGLYLLPAFKPQRYRGVVTIAVAGRFLGFLYLGAVWWSGGESAFGWLALGDGVFSVLHAALLLRARKA